jgi:hypothetical protein
MRKTSGVIDFYQQYFPAWRKQRALIGRCPLWRHQQSIPFILSRNAVLENNCAENLISANHFLRDREPWPPMQDYDNGLDDAYGLLHINGSNNSVIANHISETIDVQYLKPLGIKPVIIRLVAGKGNYIANNHIVATTETSAAQAQPSEEDACFAAQVSALLTTARLKALDAVAVLVEKNPRKTRYWIAEATIRC